MTEETRSGLPSPTPGWDGVERRRPQAEEEPPAEPFTPIPADWQSRGGAFLIDLFLYALLHFGGPALGFGILGGFLAVLYITFRDGLRRQSIGKKIMGVRVVHLDGRPISYVDSSFRNVLCRIGDTKAFKDRNLRLNGADIATQRVWTGVPNFILESKEIPVGAKLVYAMLLKYAREVDECFPGQDRLAKDMGNGERSVPLGIQNVAADFEASFRANNLQAVKDTPVLPPERIRRAIVTGVFEGASRHYPCEKESKKATSMVLSRIADTYQRIAGSAMSWDAIILTGGGSGLLYKRILPILNHERVILADDLELSIYLQLRR